MTAEKKDGHTEADSVHTGFGRILPPRLLPSDRESVQPSALSREQNPAVPVDLHSRERSSECASRCACYFSSPNQKQVSGNRATRDVQLAAGSRATSGVCRAAAPGEIEPGPQSLEECCPI